MDYSVLTSGMTWSYSRLKAFEACPYKFFLTYIMPCPSEPMFYSSYGSFMHDLLAQFYRGSASNEQLKQEFLKDFRNRVPVMAPTPKIFRNYLENGQFCLENLEKLPGEVLFVEENVRFTVGEFPFQGFIDLGMNMPDAGLVLIDHKSHPLKPRTHNGRAAKSNAELDEYLKQLYLYSIPFLDRFGAYPSCLAFNCFRVPAFITDPFYISRLEQTKQWALDVIHRIILEKDWPPNIDYYFCTQLCDVHGSCEYYQTNFES